jgi:hypothetical protein
MSWSDQVFRYCERALDATFWAEPFNALSNVGFLAAAAIAARRVRRTDETTHSQSGAFSHPAGTVIDSGTSTTAVELEARPALPDAFLWLLVALVAAIGVGSFLFHTFATRWARLVDVVPIGVFMLAYLAVALRAFLGWSARTTAAGIAAFLAANAAMTLVACPGRAVAITDLGRDPCLNSTMAYLPALATLLLVGTLVARRHPAGRKLVLAAGLFLLAITMRWLDMRTCAATALLGRPRGTHALWHLLNAATLHVLLGAMVDQARGRRPLRP